MSQNSKGTSLLVQGRIVWTLGNLFEGAVKKDRQKNPIIGKDGNQVVEYGFGLAIPKVDPTTSQNHPEYVKAYQALQGEAMSIYPQGVPQQFAFKYKDGDTDTDKNGQPYSTRTGYAGHIVIACTTRIPIKFFKFDGQNNVQVIEGFKSGDYVNVQLNIVAHPPLNGGNPGLYVNPNAVQLIAEGEAIVNAPSGDDIFGNGGVPTYQGQVQAPVAPAMPNVANGQLAQPQAPAAPAMPQAPAAPAAPAMPQAPAAPAQPHYGVLPNQMQPAQPQAPAAPAMPVNPPMPQ